MVLILQNNYWSVTQSQNRNINFDLVEAAVPKLSDGEVLIKNSFSSINYRDFLAIKGNLGVIRRFPYCPGVDLSGSILRSKSTNFKEGDRVGVWAAPANALKPGGWSRYIIAKEEAVFSLRSNWDFESTSSIGTAGLAAALGLASIHNSLNCNSGDDKKMIISGASGGVGSLAIILASLLDWTVTAISSSYRKKDFFLNLGASDIISLETFTANIKPNLLKSEYDGFIDSVGGDVLVSGLKRLKNGGSAASAGLVLSQEIENLTVLPFIMRGISITGTGSEVASSWRMEVAREYLNKIISNQKLDDITSIIQFDDLDKHVKDWDKKKPMGRSIIAI